MKDRAINLIEGALESYLLGLYGLNLPSLRARKHQESKYAPIMGMFGAASELLVKACLVQAKGIQAMFKDGEDEKVFKYGTECIDELRKEIRDDSDCISFIWKDEVEKKDYKNIMLNYLSKFHLLQAARANGLHAGDGCSKDVAVSVANDLFSFIQLLSKGKRLKAYLKGIPAPETTVRDREAIIEDLARRMVSNKTNNEKIDTLRGMYLVLPYVPEIKPDWIDCFDRISVTPPTQNDINYLSRTLQDAHSIYLLKNRGGKDGIPVRIEPQNPQALPISIQNIKRTLSSIPDQFNNDVLSANTRLEQKRLDLPIGDFLIDLFGLGIENTGILMNNTMLTAQQAWPFIAAAYSTAGTPWPCWNIIKKCNEIDKLMSILQNIKGVSNGYYKRRADTVINLLGAYKNCSVYYLQGKHDKVFDEAKAFVNKYNNSTPTNPFTPQFIRSIQLTERTKAILQTYLSNKQSAGDAIESILSENIELDDKRIVVALMRLCIRYDQRNGLIAIVRSDKMKTYHSEARKRMFYLDMLYCELLSSNV